MPAPAPATARVAGHFGELVQGLSGGEVVLITLPCPPLAVTAAWDRGGPFQLSQTIPILPEPWVKPLFQAATGNAPAGRLSITANLRAGGGCGGSTAAIVAVAQALGLRDPAAIARLCHRLEGASDPLMLREPGHVIWASRRAAVVADLPPLPGFQVIGGHLGPPQRTQADDRHFPPVDDLLDRLARTPNRETLARISTESAERNAALRRPGWLDPVRHAARATGALGLVAAHTGSACGLLFEPGQADSARCSALLAEAGVQDPITFHSPGAA